jgi:hypothetical protein
MLALGVSGMWVVESAIGLWTLGWRVRIWPLGKWGLPASALAQPDCRRVVIKGKFNRHIPVFGGSGK